MTEWIDVNPAEVKIGDEAKVDGYGKLSDRAYSFQGIEFYPVVRVDYPDLVVDWMQGGSHQKLVRVRRSSVVACRRRKPEPNPKPGDWGCANCYSVDGGVKVHVYGCKGVYRASGWSLDARTGQPWVMETGAPVRVTINAHVGVIAARLHAAEYGVYPHFPRETYAMHQARTGLDVRPVDRRKK